MQYNPIIQLSLLKVRSLLREPEALFWVFVFPLLLAVALGIAFRSRGPDELPIGVQRGEQAEWVQQALDSAVGLRAELVDEDNARLGLRSGRLALVVLTDGGWTFWYDPTRPESRRARLEVDDTLQRAAGRTDVRSVSTREMREKGSRYIDFLIPGLLGMNLMSTGMWGIGFNIVDARSKRLLKRLVATPMRRADFLLAQITGRLVFLVAEVTLLLLVARLVFGVPLRGSLVALGLISLLGAMTFAGIGLLCASRVRTVEGLSGLLNLVMMPMWIMSGIFFSTSRFPSVFQPLIQAMPLTAINDSLRSVMIEGASLASLSGEVAIAAGWAVVGFAGALCLFRWS
jgi:ABC transporter DrrB family efflux protein